MAVEQKKSKGTYVKIIKDTLNISRMTSKEAKDYDYRVNRCFKLEFELVDEPIKDSSECLDSLEPKGQNLRDLVDEFPAPMEWSDE